MFTQFSQILRGCCDVSHMATGTLASGLSDVSITEVKLHQDTTYESK